MKKYIILEVISQIIAFIVYLTVILTNQNRANVVYFNYMTSLIYFGYVITSIHIIWILVKQIRLKEYLGSKYDSMFTFYAVIAFAFIHILLIYYISEEIVVKYIVVFSLLIPFIYSLFISLLIIFEKRDKKRLNNIGKK